MKNYVKTISLCLGLSSLALAQTTTAPIYQMSIFAGIPSGVSLGDGNPSVTGIVSSPQGIAVGPNGDIFIADNTNSRIRRIDATTGIISTAALTNISNPNGMAFDSKGRLIIAQNGNNGEIVRVDLTNSDNTKSATVLAGTNVSGTFGGDGQYAYNSVLNAPGGVAVDKADNIYFTDTSNNRVRMIPNTNNCINTPGTTPGPVAGATNTLTNTCIIVTIAGNGNTVNPQVGTSCGTQLFCTPDGTNTVGDGGPALAARISGPYGIAVTPDGSKVYVSQNGDNLIRMINMLTGKISTVAGTCLSTTTATTNQSTPTTTTASGLAGAPGAGVIPTGGVVATGGTTHPLPIPCPSGSFGTKTSSSSGAQNTLYDGSVGTMATLNSPRALYLDNTFNKLYVADQSNGRIRVIDLNTGIITTAVGGGTTTGDTANLSNGGLLTSLSLVDPWGLWVSNGLIYWTEQSNNKVRVADPVAQVVHTLVNQPKSSGSEGLATQAYLGFATSLATTASPRVGVDPAGNVYIVESTTNKIRQVTPDGIIHEWAGTGQAATSTTLFDNIPASSARLNSPQQVSFDAQGNGYIADTGDNRIRMVSASTGMITTVVGRNQVTTCANPVQAYANGTCNIDKSNYVGDGGPPSNALLSSPQGVTVDSLGNLIIADTGHQAIRYADMTNNVIYTIAGGTPANTPSGTPVVNGPTDGRSGLGSNSGQLDSTNAVYGLVNNVRGVAVDKNGNVYYADYSNAHVGELVKLNTAVGAYSLFTFYGSGSSSGTAPNIPTGTGAPSVPARIRISSSNATSVAVDSGNNIYYALAADNRVVVVTADHSAVYIVAGGGSADTGLNFTTGNAANLETPAVTGVAVDANGVVYTADRTGLVRKLVCTKNCLPLK